MKQRYSYRAYPGTRQRRDLARLFGCTRFIYNSVIADRKMIYETCLHLESEPVPGKPGKTRRTFTANRQAALITAERARRPWLNDVSSVALIQAMRDAEQAFTNFFESVTKKRKGPRVGFPRFKKRSTKKQAARFTRNGFRVDQTRGRVFLAKIGWINLAWSRDLPSDPSSVTVTHRSDGVFEVSFVVEVDAAPVLEHPADRHAGIDLGLDTFAAIVASDGTREKVENPRFLVKARRRLRREQRALSRKIGPDKRTKQRPSENWKKQRAKVAREHARVRDTRQDFARKLALRVAREYTTIAVEDLSIRGLARAGGRNAQGRGLRRSVHDAAWGAFLRRLGDIAGDRVIPVNPAYTSQTCGVCTTLDGPKPLRVRAWTCPSCQARLDRDWNAAVNILVAAGHAETQNACGEDIRLQLAGAALAETGTHWSADGMAA